MKAVDLEDLMKVNVTFVRGSTPGGVVGRTVLVSTFVTSDTFEGRTLLLQGPPSVILDDLLSRGFARTSVTYRQAEAFLNQEIPPGEVLIGRRDAGDADYGVTLDAIDAEDGSFSIVVVETRNKAQMTQVANWCRTRKNLFVATNREAGALTKADGTFAHAIFTDKINEVAYLWYDPRLATGWAAAHFLSQPGPFALSPGQSYTLSTVTGSAYDGLTRNVQILGTAASVVSSGYTDGLADGETITMIVDDHAEITVVLNDDPSYFPDGIANATDPSQVIAYLTDYVPTVTWSLDTGEIRATSQRQGTGSKIQFTGGTGLATVGFVVGTTSGTGNALFVDNTTAAEKAAIINTAATGVAQVTTATLNFNGTDVVGLKVDALATISVACDTDAPTTLTAWKAAWDASPAHLATATAAISGDDIVLTFTDFFDHVVIDDSAATADYDPITSTAAAPPLALVASAFGTRLKVELTVKGEEFYFEVGDSPMLAALGIEAGLYYGTGTDENYIDAMWAGLISYESSLLDQPDGSVPADNAKLRAPGNVLSAGQRKAVQEYNGNTYEKRTSNFPGEIHWGVTGAGFNVDFFVVMQLWMPLRIVEQVKSFTDKARAMGRRIPYSDAGIAQFSQEIQRPFRVAQSAGGIVFDPNPPTVDKPLGWITPTIEQQSASNRAAEKITGWRAVIQDAGSIKAAEISIIALSQ